MKYILSALLLVVRMVAVEDSTISIAQFSPQDQQEISVIAHEAADIQKEIELAQTKIQLAQSQLARINEVKLPALEQHLRESYKLPKDQWDWNLQTLTFTKKAQKVEAK